MTNDTLIAAMTAALEDGVDGPQALPAEITSNRMLFVLNRAAPAIVKAAVDQIAAQVRANVEEDNELLDTIAEATGSYLFEDGSPASFADGIASYVENVGAVLTA